MGKHNNYFLKLWFIVAAGAIVWGYGVLSHQYKLFPYPQIKNSLVQAREAVMSLAGQSKLISPWWYIENSDVKEVVKYHVTQAVSLELILLSGVSANNELMAKIVDNNGNTIHSWQIDWFKLWPNPEHLKAKLRPKEKPGGNIHGIIFMPNGDLVFNFERLGLIRLDYCGNVVWRFPYRTHHSLHLDNHGNFWTAGQINNETTDFRFPNYTPPFEEFTILEISPEGKLLSEISVAELLIENGLKGLLYMSSTGDNKINVTGDTLHLNDVELFPLSMDEGAFKHGDILISLRNINAVIVFSKETRQIRYLNIGSVVHQHDPDFVDGNTISVFDNNNLNPVQDSAYSRIVSLNAVSGDINATYKGTNANPFFTNMMGKHQILPNGNILITESRKGRAFEVTAQGTIVWEIYNIVDNGVLGLLDEAQRLPPEFNKSFFNARRGLCATL